MIYLISVLLVLLVVPILLTMVFNKKIEQTIPLWIVSIILIIYFFGLFSLTHIGFYLVIALSVCSIIAIVIWQFKSKRLTKQNTITTGLIAFVLLVVISYISNRGLLFHLADEYSHWATIVKNIYLLNGFGAHENSTIIFNEYPPATAIFEYFMIKLSGNFVEGYAYVGMNVLYFSFMVHIFKDTSFKDYKRILINLVIILIVPVIFMDTFYKSLKVDVILGVFFAYVLIFNFTNKVNLFYIINLLLTFALIVLTKASGAGLAAIASIVIIVDMVFYNKQQVKDFVNENKVINKILLVVSFIFMVFIKYSWKLYFDFNHLSDVFNTAGVTFTGLKEVLINNQDFSKTVISEFMVNLTNIFTSNSYFELSFFSWIAIISLIFVVLIGFILKDQSKEKQLSKRLEVTYWILFLGGAGYLISLLFTYLTIFSPEEAKKAASMMRYVSTYLLSVFMFAVLIFIMSESKIKSRKTVGSVVLVLLLIVSINIRPVLDYVLLFEGDNAHSVTVRNDYAQVALASENLQPQDQVYLVAIGCNSYDYFACRYLLTPVNIDNAISIGSKEYEQGDGTKIITKDEWANELYQSYDYVYIHKANDQFFEWYQEIFEGEKSGVRENMLYMIDKTNDDIVLVGVDQ